MVLGSGVSPSGARGKGKQPSIRYLLMALELMLPTCRQEEMATGTSKQNAVVVTEVNAIAHFSGLLLQSKAIA
jgi:hypothetical protein